MMLYAVIKESDGYKYGVNRTGVLQANRGDVELMDLEDAERVAKAFGGEVVSEDRLFPGDFE